MLCSVIEHGMTSLSFQTAMQKNEMKRSGDQMGIFPSKEEGGGGGHKKIFLI